MTDRDPRCEACGEPRSQHVPTEKDPQTCPRVARGEGAYVFVCTRSGGVWCNACYGPCDGHQVYRFVPVAEMTEAERKACGFAVAAPQ
jgi:hypothetical protein